jgi:hypothetical protein
MRVRLASAVASGFVVGSLALVGCGDGAHDKSVSLSAQGPSKPATPDGEPRLDQLRSCVEEFGSAPVNALVDREPARSVAAAIAGTKGQINGSLVGLETRAAPQSSVSAEVDGRMQTVDLENTDLVLVIDVVDQTGVDGVSAGKPIRVAIPFVSGVAGASVDPELGLARLKAECPSGTSIRLYPRSVAQTPQGAEVSTTAQAMVLVAGDGRIVSFDPLVPQDKPLGVTTVDELSAADG